MCCELSSFPIYVYTPVPSEPGLLYLFGDANCLRIVFIILFLFLLLFIFIFFFLWLLLVQLDLCWCLVVTHLTVLPCTFAVSQINWIELDVISFEVM